MKKLMLPLICLFAFTSANAEDFTASMLLPYPVGIFDTFTASGDVEFDLMEVGTRHRTDTATGTSYYIGQSQTVGVFGNTHIQKGNASTNYLRVNGSLVFLPGSGSMQFTNVYVYLNRIFATSNLSIGNLRAAKINTFGNIGLSSDTGSSPAALTVRTVPSANTLEFKTTSSAAKLPSRVPGVTTTSYRDGSRMKWKKATKGTHEYGEWKTISIGTSDNCNDNAFNDYTCTIATPPSQNPCLDVRTLENSEPYFSTEGGFYVSEIVGRKECTLIDTDGTTRCAMPANYDFSVNTAASEYKDFGGILSSYGPYQNNSYNDIVDCRKANNTLLTVSEFNSAISAGEQGKLCSIICGGTCTQMSSCVVTGSHAGASLRSGIADANHTTAATNIRNEPGMVRSTSSPNDAKCERTIWPTSTGLGCTNAWEEANFTVITCGQGSGRYVNDAVRYEARDVTCATSGNDDTDFSSAYYLILDN